MGDSWDPDGQANTADRDEGDDDNAPADLVTPTDPTLNADADPPPADLEIEPLPSSKGWDWVRSNPLFLSGLVVSMTEPPASWVHDYFDGFGANAVHLWATGLPDEVADWQAARPEAPWVVWTQANGTSAANGLLAGGLDENPPGRIGYQVGDEPGNEEAYQATTIGVAALREHDPEALLILNFLGAGDMRERCASNLDFDIFSYDDYSRDKSSYRSLAEARAAGLRFNKPYWRYLNAYTNADMGNEHEESDQRWDAFSGLVFGFTGHTWFLYQVLPTHDLFPITFATNGDYNVEKTAHWNMLAQINRELLNLGRPITQLISTDVRFVPGISLLTPDGLNEWAPGAGDDPYIKRIAGASGEFLLQLLVGYFRDARGATYVMIQNVRHANGSWPSDSSSTGQVVVEFDFSQAPAGFNRAALLGLDKLDGQVKTLPLFGSGERRTLDITLAAGDPVFFKYDDGRPYVQGR